VDQTNFAIPVLSIDRIGVLRHLLRLGQLQLQRFVLLDLCLNLISLAL